MEIWILTCCCCLGYLRRSSFIFKQLFIRVGTFFLILLETLRQVKPKHVLLIKETTLKLYFLRLLFLVYLGILMGFSVVFTSFTFGLYSKSFNWRQLGSLTVTIDVFCKWTLSERLLCLMIYWSLDHLIHCRLFSVSNDVYLYYILMISTNNYDQAMLSHLY